MRGMTRCIVVLAWTECQSYRKNWTWQEGCGRAVVFRQREESALRSLLDNVSGPSLRDGLLGSFLLRAPRAQAWLSLEPLTCPWGNNPKAVGGTPGGIPALRSHCEQPLLLFITLLSLNKFLFFYHLFYIFKKLLESKHTLLHFL